MAPSNLIWRAIPLKRDRGRVPATDATERVPPSTLRLNFDRALWRIAPKAFGVGGERRIRTFEGISQQIYSLPRLATSVSLHASRETRNSNPEIRNNPVRISNFVLRISPPCGVSGRWESNPPHQLGRLAHYHYATPATVSARSMCPTVCPLVKCSPAGCESSASERQSPGRPHRTVS
jgi:hypothetical protein